MKRFISLIILSFVLTGCGAFSMNVFDKFELNKEGDSGFVSLSDVDITKRPGYMKLDQTDIMIFEIQNENLEQNVLKSGFLMMIRYYEEKRKVFSDWVKTDDFPELKPE